MAGEARKAAGLLSTAGVDIIVYGCTTGSLVGGVDWEESLVGGIENETGIRTVSTGGAVVEAIIALGGGRVAVATPYTDDLNDLERAFLESRGVEVTSIRGLGLVRNLDIGRTGWEDVERLAKSVAAGSDLVFISCTNLPTIYIIGKLEKELGRQVVTSNQASMWAALRGSGITGLEGYGELLRSRLA